MQAPARGTAIGLVVAFVLAGCLAPAPAAVPDDAPPRDDGDPLRLEPLAWREEPPSLARPPAWRVGEWWRYEITDAFSGETRTSTRVVVGGEGDHYVVGFPIEEQDAADDIITLHLPGLGEVRRDDFSFLVHDEPFVPVRFPLVEGQTWRSAFESPLTEARVVEVVNATLARIQYSEIPGEAGGPAKGTGNATYDAAIGELVELSLDEYADIRVVAHGFDHQGVVVVPRGQDFVFVTGRAMGVLWGEAPMLPLDEVLLNDSFDRLSFNFFMGGFRVGPLDAPGVFRERATAPDGTVYERTVTPADAPGIHAPTFHHDHPAGVWRFEHEAVGFGIVATEGIGYDVVHVELPGMLVTHPLAT